MESFLEPAQRVVVTGIGLETPLGEGREITWRRLCDGETGIVGGRAVVPVEDTEVHRALHFALLAAEEAVDEAKVLRFITGERAGCIVSSSKPLLSEAHENKDGLSYLEPNSVPRAVARYLEMTGPQLNVTSACATGLHSVMVGAEWIREGRCDVVLAGASESSLHPLYQAGFSQMGVLSPSGCVRPFDRQRNGFVLGEGAAVLCLESLQHVRERGAKYYGELLGWDISSDGEHAFRFNSNGERIARSLRRALQRGGVSTDVVDYINAHGTATPLNDRLEVQALLSVFNDKRRVRVSSTNAATGHLLGATGAVELAFCLLAMRDEIAPPTLNLDSPETDLLDFLPNRAKPCFVDYASTLSFGFGGAIASMVAGNAVKIRD